MTQKYLTKQNHEQENLEIPTQAFTYYIYWNNPSSTHTSLWSLSDLLQGEIMQIVKNDKTNSKTLSGK